MADNKALYGAKKAYNITEGMSGGSGSALRVAATARLRR
jgi:hypothetical protein